jgi:hypothetical protein
MPTLVASLLGALRRFASVIKCPVLMLVRGVELVLVEAVLVVD